MYVNTETIKKLSTTAVINYIGEEYLIVFNDDQVRGFLYKETGLISTACPTNSDNNKHINYQKENDEISDTVLLYQ